MSHLSRRGFLAGSLAAAGAGLLPVRRVAQAKDAPSGRVIGANEKVRVAVAGFNGRGSGHISAYTGMKDVELAYLVDPDSRLFGANIKRVLDKTGREPQALQDIRRVLDDKTIDAISIAAPNHWHSLMTIWACQAGKHVYVEKPLSHNLREGRVAVEIARRYNRVVQHGTQTRSERGMIKALTALRAGKFGKIRVARALCYKGRPSIGFKPNGSPPAEVDFNLWLGPAPEQPYHENLVHYNWHWFWDTGNGDIGNQGVHQMDVALWGLGEPGLPKNALSLGGRFGYEDQGQTPNTQLAFFDYGDAQLIFEVRGLPTERFHPAAGGASNVFHCEDGTLVGEKFYPTGSDKPAPIPDVEIKPGPGGEHFGNFIAAVRSGKASDLNAPVERGHYSSALCHLANASYRTGEKVPFNPKTRAFGDNKEAYETLARMEEHLAGKNGLKLEEINYQLGRRLTIDAESETVDDSAAQKILAGAGQYRGEFTVPMAS